MYPFISKVTDILARDSIICLIKLFTKSFGKQLLFLALGNIHYISVLCIIITYTVALICLLHVMC